MQYRDLLLGAAGCFVATALIMPFYISWLRRLKAGQSIREEGPESHMSKAGTPTMGGLAFIAAGAIFTIIFAGCSKEILVIVGALLAFGTLGFLDDIVKVSMKRNLGLTAGQKILLQIIIALALALYGTGGKFTGNLWIPFVNSEVNMGVLYVPFIAFVIVAMVNSVNLTDGLDGLAGFTSFVVCVAFTIIAIGTGFADIAVFPAVLASGIAGFLIFNRYPAKIFMGDTGSLAIGGSLAAVAIVIDKEMLLPVAGGIFVLEALSVIIQVVSFKTRGKRVFKMAPLHHHFELSGYKETKVVGLFTFITVVLSAAAVFIAI